MKLRVILVGALLPEILLHCLGGYLLADAGLQCWLKFLRKARSILFASCQDSYCGERHFAESEV